MAQFNRDPEDIPESRRQPALSGMSGGERACRPLLRQDTRSPADTAEKANASSRCRLDSPIAVARRMARADFFDSVLLVAVKQAERTYRSRSVVQDPAYSISSNQIAKSNT
jgi:hypothetical protein